MLDDGQVLQDTKNYTGRAAPFDCAQGGLLAPRQAENPLAFYSVECGATGRVIRRNRMIAAVTATDPYSSSITQPGSTHGRPSVRRCQTMYVGIMLTVQMISGNVDFDRTNGSSQSKYHGYTTGAQRSDAAIGQANASADSVWDLVLNQTAIRTPTKAASAAMTCGVRHSLEQSEYRIVKTKALDVSTERACRNSPVV